MNRGGAVDVLERAILTSDGFAEITTWPTNEQREACQSIARDDIAPREVCDEMDMDPGTTWGGIVDALRHDWAPFVVDALGD